MSDEALLAQLRDLEVALHRIEVRRDTTRMQRLLHESFEEIGRSGRRYSRDEILTEFAGGKTLPVIASHDFRLVRLGEDLALLTYESAHVDDEDNGRRRTLRASLWLRTEPGWRIVFHQGTPVDDAG